MKKITNSIPILISICVLANPVASFAASNTQINIKPGNQFVNIENLTIGGIISGLIRLLLIVAALIFFFMLVIGGIQWIMSGGDKTASENARKRITSALIGLAIVFSAWAIAKLVETMFGVNILDITLPTFN